MKNKFTVEMETGRQSLVPSDLRLELTLLDGTGKSAGPFPLKKTFISLLEVRIGGKVENHEIETDALDSDVAAVRLHAKRGRSLFNDLYICHFHIRETSRGFSAFVPVYSWIEKGNNRVLFAGRPMIPNDSSLTSVQRKLRQEDIAYQQSVYDSSKFVRLPGLPVAMTSKYVDLPRDERFDDIKGKQVLYNIAAKIARVGLAKVSDIVDSWKSFEDMDETLYNNFDSFDKPLVAYDWYWATDEGFGRQVFTAVNPTMVELLHELPSDIGVSAEFLNEKVPVLRNKDIDAELKAGKFVFLDYRALLQDICDEQEKTRQSEQANNPDEDQEHYYMAPAVCLLYFDESVGTCVPVAIQLKKDGHVYTPPEEGADENVRNRWLMAKMFVANADTQYHQLATHLLRTHLVIEAFALATRRMFSSVHPLYRLLKPHLHFTMAINALARQTLLASIAALFSIGDHAVGLAAKAYEDWNVFDFNPEVQLERKGFGTNARTPLTKEGAYPWREDTLDLWPAIKSYVKEFLQVYYKGDDNIVKEDTELQKWRLEVLALHPGKEFPPIETQDQLAEVLSIIIWIASAGHASVNFNQFQTYGFQPNHPAQLRLPIPEEIQGQITTQTLLDALPNIASSVQAMALANSLSEYAENEVYLGDISEGSFQDDSDALAVQVRFRQSLDQVTSKIETRNNGVRSSHPYVWMLPKKISNSIAV